MHISINQNGARHPTPHSNNRKMNTQKRQQLESKLKGKVNLWMDVSKGDFTDEVETRFLTVKDLSDRELVDLNFCLNLGKEFGSLTKEDRNESVLTLDFDLK